MADIRMLNPHDPIPEGGRAVVVMRRFDEDNPHTTRIEIMLTHRKAPPELARPVRPDGHPMSLEEAAEAGRRVADEEGLTHVLLIDRTAGPRERDILQHGGDHSVHMERLEDDDLDEGERGPDMRDRS
jgi:hypothetical protein